MFNVKYLAMYKAQMHAGAISKLFVRLYGKIIHSLKLVDYLPVQAHKIYNKLYIN